MSNIGNVWVFVEQEGGKIADVSLELVSKGAELAATLNVSLEAVLLGNNVAHCADTLFSYGCKKVFLAEDPRLEPFTVLPYAKVIMDLIRERRPNILLFGATMKGRELAPRIASEKLAGLTADRTVITADGQSLSFITVQVVDEKGWFCPDAAIDCEATVKGAGKLLAFASADLKDTEPYTSPRVKTWKGRALLVVRSTQKKGSVNVSIKSALPTASLSLKSK